MAIVESTRAAERAIFSQRLGAGEPWMHRVEAGQYFRIVDAEGNQAVDTLFFNAEDPSERYDAQNTIVAQANLYLTAGSVLMSDLGRPMLTIVADTCGRHDTLGGACAAESNTVRYALDKRYMHSCRDNFLRALSARDDLASHLASSLSTGPFTSLNKRDLVSNINFFMNVPVTSDGGLTFEDGISAPGKYVEMRAEMPVIVLISNCPQLNNPCNGYNPTPIDLLVWDAQ